MDCQFQTVKLDPRPHSWNRASILMPTIRFFCVICGTALKGTTESPTSVVECHSCSRHVPVPRLADVPGSSVGCAPVFPPEILAVEVKFLCTSCQSRLGADARWEGRGVICSVCGDRTRVPRWSRVSQWPRADDGAKTPGLGNVTLSSEEIAFLSSPAPTNPGASA